MDIRNPTTRAVASFITRTTYADLPVDVERAARRAILDALGCALGGVETPLVSTLTGSLAAQGVTGPCAVIGGGIRLPTAWAGLVDAIAINALDFDDTYEDGTNPISHPGSSSVGAVLAFLAQQDVDLGAAISAAAVGYEITIRVARAAQPSQAQRDLVWGLGPHQVFGSTAVAARLLGLDEQQAIASLGLSGVHTSVPSVWTAAGWLKDAVGWPTMTGIMSAYLAASAFGAPERIFDGRRSYYRTVASDTFRPELLVGDLGVRWHLTSLSFKPYPCCRWIHPVLDALTSMRDRADLRLTDVDRIDIAGFWELERLFLRYRPRDLVDAQFSLPYACAHVLARTPPGPAWFEESAIDDQAILALADRVHVTTDARIEAERLDDPNALRARIEVLLRDGRVLEDERAVAHGHPTDPMTEAEALAKFVILAEPLLGDGSEGLGRAILEADADRSLSGLIEPAFRAVARAGST